MRNGRIDLVNWQVTTSFNAIRLELVPLVSVHSTFTFKSFNLIKCLMLLLTKISLTFAVNVLTLIIAILSVSRVKGSPQFRPIIVSLIAFLGLSVCYFFDNSIYRLGTLIFYQLEYIFVLVLCYAFFEACVRMSTDLSSTQLRNVRIGAALPSTIWLGLWIYTVITNNDQAALYYALLLILPIGLIFLTTIWLFVRLGALSGWSPAGLVRGWRDGKPMLWETGSFFLIITLTALASLVLIMLRARVADQVTLMVLFIAMNGAIILLITIFYLKYVARRYDVASQLQVGLQAIFLVASAFVLIAFFDDEQMQPSADLSQIAHHQLDFEPLADGTTRVTLASYQPKPISLNRMEVDSSGLVALELPFIFPFADQISDTLWITRHGSIALQKPVTDTGVHCLNGALRIVPFCSGGNEYTPRVFVGQSHAIIEWSDTNSGAFISRLTLNSNGRFSFAYDRLPSLPSLGRNFQIGFSTQDAPLPQSLSFDDLPFVTSVGALWFDLTLMHRQTLDSVYLPVFGFMIGVSFLNAFLVLWWVNARVRRPLARTHEALEGIRQGILNNNLGAANYDEFSDLAESFGRMEEQLRNLRSGQDEITDAIEAELKARHVDKSIEAKLPEAVSADQQLLERILDVVEKSSDQTNFQVLDLAEAVGLSTRQLHRKVLDLAGVTPLTLIRTTRLKKARRILETGGSTVSQAAFGSGFRDLAYFSKLYRKEFGELPSRTASSKA